MKRVIWYYIALGIGAFILTMFIMLNVGILIGLAAGVALGVICGIIGGELEFIERRKARRKRYGVPQRTEEPDRIIVFPANIE